MKRRESVTQPNPEQVYEATIPHAVAQLHEKSRAQERNESTKCKGNKRLEELQY